MADCAAACACVGREGAEGGWGVIQVVPHCAVRVSETLAVGACTVPMSRLHSTRAPTPRPYWSFRRRRSLAGRRVRAQTTSTLDDCHRCGRRCRTVCPLGFAQKTNLQGVEQLQNCEPFRKITRIQPFAQRLNVISRERHGSRTVGPGLAQLLAQRSNVRVRRYLFGQRRSTS